MRNRDPLENVRERLRQHGLPAAYICRVVRELAEHREDLVTEAKDQGLSGEASERFVSERMGNVDELAGKLARGMQTSNWRGRHPVFSFCFLPLGVFLGGFLLVMLMAAGVGEVAGWWATKSTLSAGTWSNFALGVHLLRWALFAAVPFWFCWLARSSYCGYKWAFATCLMFSIHGLFHVMRFVPPRGDDRGSLTWGYGSQLDSLGLAIPFGVFLLFWMLTRRSDAREIDRERSRA